jgi:hypothetical protein
MIASINDVKDILSKTPHDISVGLWGPPGIGKTDLCIQVADAIGAKFLVKLAATMDPTDLVGIPFPDKSGNVTKFLPPADLFQLTVESGNKEPWVVCFDDITTANPQVFAALFRLFQHREVAGYHIRDNVRLLATGNRAEDNAAANDMPTALNNRFFHIDLAVNAAEWGAWAIQNNIQPTICGYIKNRPDQLHVFKPDSQERAFATPRSIVMASRMEAAVGVGTPQWHLAIAGCVGEGWSAGYRAFIKNTVNLVKPEDIMKDPAKCRVPEKAAVDVIHATVSTLTHYIKNHASVDNCLKSFTYLERIPHADMGMAGVHAIMDNVVQPHPDTSLKAKIINSPQFTKLMTEHGFLLL